jgi:hypothetical protein
VHSVARSLVKLNAASVLNWVRRCVESFQEGRFTVEQEATVHAVRTATSQRGSVSSGCTHSIRHMLNPQDAIHNFAKNRLARRDAAGRPRTIESGKPVIHAKARTGIAAAA